MTPNPKQNQAEWRLELGEKMKQARLARGYGLREIAARVGTTHSTVRRIETGQDVLVSHLREYAALVGLVLDVRAAGE